MHSLLATDSPGAAGCSYATSEQINRSRSKIIQVYGEGRKCSQQRRQAPISGRKPRAAGKGAAPPPTCFDAHTPRHQRIDLSTHHQPNKHTIHFVNTPAKTPSHPRWQRPATARRWRQSLRRQSRRPCRCARGLIPTRKTATRGPGAGCSRGWYPPQLPSPWRRQTGTSL